MDGLFLLSIGALNVERCYKEADGTDYCIKCVKMTNRLYFVLTSEVV